MAFISLDDAKAQLNITSTTYDVELGDFVDAACDVVETWCGAIAQRTITGERIDTPRPTLSFTLRYRPAQSIQSITSARTGGTAYAVGDFLVDSDTGLVRRKDGSAIYEPLTVDYTAGYATAPAWARMAAKIIVQHLWKTQRGGGARPGSSSEAPTPGYGFAIPNAAVELMEAHRAIPGIG